MNIEKLTKVAESKWVTRSGVDAAKMHYDCTSKDSPMIQQIQKDYEELKQRYQDQEEFKALALKYFNLKYWKENVYESTDPISNEKIPPWKGLLLKINGKSVVYSRKTILNLILKNNFPLTEGGNL